VSAFGGTEQSAFGCADYAPVRTAVVCADWAALGGAIALAHTCSECPANRTSVDATNWFSVAAALRHPVCTSFLDALEKAVGAAHSVALDEAEHSAD
jgi:hypothetical protein